MKRPLGAHLDVFTGHWVHMMDSKNSTYVTYIRHTWCTAVQGHHCRYATKLGNKMPLFLRILILLLVAGRGVYCQEQNELRYDLNEEEIAGHIIGNIKVDSGIFFVLQDPEAKKRIRFQFLTNPALNLAIDDVTGVLRVSGRIDRDSLCPSKPECLIHLDIATKPAQDFRIIKVVINLLDKNDNSPEFPQPEMTFKILESSAIGTSIVIPVAKDLDSPRFGISKYEHISIDDSFTFGLKESTKIDGTSELKVVLASRLNREERDRYQLRVTAYDGGTPSRTGAMDIYIEVEDTNDNPPVFLNTTYYVTVPESIPKFSSLVEVKAVDRDLGLNGEVEYYFSPYTQESFGTIFSVDRVSGVIRLMKPLDYETTALYTLTVAARDKGPNSIPSEATVVVTVQDENDHKPSITMNTLTSTNTDIATVPEHAAVGTFVAHISVEDLDSGRNGRVNCSLNNRHFILNTLHHNQYKISTTESLDREVKATYRLNLTCKDEGVKPQDMVQTITVNVEDINDNEPIFSRQSYSATMMENNYEGYVVLQVNATDADTGPNAQVRYVLSPDVNKFLSINSTSGVITARKKLDREDMETVHFYVYGHDGGKPSLTGTTMVNIVIEDVNDEPPRFSEAGYSFSVYENEDPGFSVGVVKAEDADAEPNNEFYFTLQATNSRNLEKFEIDQKTGEVRTLKKLDREETSVYMFTIRAVDAHNPALTSTADLTVFIVDRNDEVPEWRFPSKVNSTIYISNKAPPKHQLARLEAIDVDVHDKIEYEIRRGNEEELFTLNPSSGILSVNKALNFIQYQMYRLEVVAKDSNRPPHTASANLYIVVNESIAFPLQQTGSKPLFGGMNFTIVISLACSCILLSIVLVTVIVVIRKKERRKREHKYNCRMEALKMLTAKDNEANGSNAIPDRSPLHITGGHVCYDERYTKCPTEEHKEIPFCDDVKTGNSLNGTWSGTEKHKVKFASPPDRYIGANGKAGRLGDGREVEVHRLLEGTGSPGGVPGDGDSLHSGDGSNTDSGRGPSEEGEAAGARPFTDTNKGVGSRQSQYNRLHCSTLPIYTRPHVHMNQLNNTTTRFQTFSPPTKTPLAGVEENPSSSHTAVTSESPHPTYAKQVMFTPSHKTEITYVPKDYASSQGSPASSQGRYYPQDTAAETTFTSEGADTVETTYVPHSISTLSNCRTRYNQKYFPVNSKAKDTTL